MSWTRFETPKLVANALATVLKIPTQTGYKKASEIVFKCTSFKTCKCSNYNQNHVSMNLRGAGVIIVSVLDKYLRFSLWCWFKDKFILMKIVKEWYCTHTKTHRFFILCTDSNKIYLFLCVWVYFSFLLFFKCYSSFCFFGFLFAMCKMSGQSEEAKTQMFFLWKICA